MKVIILAGGSGTRLWPLSRERYPKQFIKIEKEKPSLFQETIKRSLILTPLDNIYVVTNEMYKFLVMGQVEEMGLKYNENNILVEPEAKNTLPAIYAGVYQIAKNGHDSVIVFPSDHIIKKDDVFVKKIIESEKLTVKDIVTFGIKPNIPDTGFGYIAPGKKNENGFKVADFKEKPDYKTAESYLQKGYLWNSGIFMMNTEVFIREVIEYAPQIYKAFDETEDIRSAFEKITEKISVDYGIMEKTTNVSVVPVDIGWNDLGSYDAFFEVYDQDENSNIISSDSINIDSQGNYIYSEGNKIITTVGVEDLIVVDNRDALIVCKRGHSQQVKKVVDELRERDDKRLKYHVKDIRPWGNYKELENKPGSFKARYIEVLPGRSVSYQLHHHRSEHWIVVKGMAKVNIEGQSELLYRGSSIYIKPGERHKIENPGKISLEVIEVQIGDYVEEDDIVRFENSID